ncbi:glycine betaine ABC transporter substrate-binding protein [Desulfosudis oleivorans]|uniref:Substrate-binding region of ABC-type glycine betaine transport system n=1 Tax=Desulfosudis oleivorans (strain DSM 6200 / JCM 39069 / Hxd3) TaxID=96561 RepID=A8ZXT9_DESOH|nr:glycine betaine ABC transporter substrate-binding protein [Desulfosudis oleivorans]ABW68566.1 Substrate-binding region of ABC-type glycine betaine transport system [Desulfosudis oleivorans Hxd3]
MKRMLSILIVLALGMALGLGPATAKDKTAEIVYVEWSCATASANVVKAVLETKMGYDVELTPVSAAAMWQALATGDVDACTTAWLPTTHGHYYDKVKNKVENLGHNLVGTRIGLVVPAYVTIDSIEELDANADKFDGQITGIDPGAGIMSKTEAAIKAYKMKKMELMEGSGAMMTMVLSDKIKNKEWVVVTGWTPHWKFGRWDLKYLEDPLGIYGGDEYIDTIVRKGLKKDKPDLYAFLDRFEWTPEDIQTVMAWNQEKGTTPEENAVKWVKQNPDKVAAWLPK